MLSAIWPRTLRQIVVVSLVAGCVANIAIAWSAVLLAEWPTLRPLGPLADDQASWPTIPPKDFPSRPTAISHSRSCVLDRALLAATFMSHGFLKDLEAFRNALSSRAQPLAISDGAFNGHGWTRNITGNATDGGLSFRWEDGHLVPEAGQRPTGGDEIQSAMHSMIEELDVELAMMDGGDPGRYSAEVVTVGWPFRVFRGVRWIAEQGDVRFQPMAIVDVELSAAVVVNGSEVQPFIGHYPTERIFPYEPLTYGLILGSIVHAAVLTMVLLLISWLRGHLLSVHGRCRVCGYLLTGQARCPECGSPVNSGRREGKLAAPVHRT